MGIQNSIRRNGDEIKQHHLGSVNPGCLRAGIQQTRDVLGSTFSRVRTLGLYQSFARVPHSRILLLLVQRCSDPRDQLR